MGSPLHGPSSSTKITSAFSILERRWAMTNTNVNHRLVPPDLLGGFADAVLAASIAELGGASGRTLDAVSFSKVAARISLVL